MGSSSTIDNHDKIRTWIEARGGHPARVKGAKPGDALRVDFGESKDPVEEISWEEFFEIFDQTREAFLHPAGKNDQTTGRKINH